jgi:hypothetical protein
MRLDINAKWSLMQHVGVAVFGSHQVMAWLVAEIAAWSAAECPKDRTKTNLISLKSSPSA